LIEADLSLLGGGDVRWRSEGDPEPTGAACWGIQANSFS